MLSQAMMGGLYIAAAFTAIGLISLPLGYLAYMHFEGYRFKNDDGR